MAGVTLGFLKFVLGLDTIAFKKGMTQAERELVVMQKNFAKVGKGMTNLGKSMSLAVSAPLLAIGTIGVKMAADFETSMNAVGISTEATAAELKAMEDLALDIGKSTTKSASESASAMDMLAKAGMKTSDILDGGARATVALAEATGSALDPAAAAVTDTMAQFGLTAKQLPFIINNITGAVNESKFDFADFQLGMSQAGGVAASSGLKFEEFSAALAATSSQFASGSDAGTSFKTFLLRLTPDTKKAATAMSEAGFNAYDAAGKMKPLADIAEQLRVKFGSMSEGDRIARFKVMFGQDAVRTAIGLYKAGAEGITEMQERIAKTDAAEQSAKRMKGFNAELEKLKGALETLAITVAKSGLLEQLTGLVQKLAEFVDWLGTLDKDTLKWGVTLTGVAIALGPLLIGLGAIVSAIAKIGPAVRLLVTGFGLLRAGVVLMAPAFAGMLIPLAAAAAAVTAVYLAFKYWPQITKFVSDLQKAIQTYLKDKLKVVFEWLKGRIDAVVGWFKWMADQVALHSIVPDMVAAIGASMAKLDAQLVEPAKKGAKATVDTIRAMKEEVAALLAQLFPEVVAMRAYEENLKRIAFAQKNLGLSADEAALAQERLMSQFIGGARADGPLEVSDWLTGMPEANVEAGEAVLKTISEIGKVNKDKTAEMAKQWGDMAVSAIGSMRGMVDAFKSGDILGGIQTLLSAVTDLIASLAQIGVFGKNVPGYGGARMAGGPVVPGKTYLVGEKGPEFVTPSRKGFVQPSGSNAQPQRVIVIPSPYFDVVVDHRAANIAAPMAGQAAVVGVTGTEARMVRRSRRNLLAA